jgi:putative tryptophan/tyrosine transport system substrate-binding protein
MKRRDLLILLGGAAVSSVAARAQQPAVPVIGYVGSGSSDADTQVLAPFRKGLSEMGYVEGRNLAIEYRYAQNQLERLPELLADLVRRRVAVIATPGSDAVAAAAKAATSTVPVVFEIGGDPVQSGLVASLNRPGGNMTGITSMNSELSGKRLGLLHELLPQARRFAVLVNPTSPAHQSMMKVLPDLASRIGVQVEFFEARTISEIDTAFTSHAQKQAEALLVNGGPPFNDRAVQIATLTARYTLPTMFVARTGAAAGGLMSYATSPDRFRQVGLYAGRILKGEKPADLPVMLPTKFEFVINLQTAKLLNLTFPPGCSPSRTR